MKFGEKLRQLRLEKGFTQEEVASAVNVSRRTYIGYEQEELYSQLAQVLDTETSYLLTEDEEFVSQASDKYGNRGKLQAEKLVAELSGMFAGGELSDSDKDAVMIALQKAYFDCKEDNKKYTPKKYRKE